ncbi:hypothetical protein PCANC_02622 [Puccinia coronata f. sp. avenae]|uniref:Uncharacterized protein n=1 Tax=Puccinia coronata f. sp. avenae TaxID=200324 RepID=A0A2N5W5N4_9BASI|nr:hypothetical protein PCANC_02622 [Puccinia coronata f. sp. avenae]
MFCMVPQPQGVELMTKQPNLARENLQALVVTNREGSAAAVSLTLCAHPEQYLSVGLTSNVRLAWRDSRGLDTLRIDCVKHLQKLDVCAIAKQVSTAPGGLT